MNLKEKILLLKEQGISYKYLANITNINQNTLYGYTAGQRNLSLEKEEKLEKYIDILLSLK